MSELRTRKQCPTCKRRDGTYVRASDVDDLLAELVSKIRKGAPGAVLKRIREAREEIK